MCIEVYIVVGCCRAFYVGLLLLKLRVFKKPSPLLYTLYTWSKRLLLCLGSGGGARGSENVCSECWQNLGSFKLSGDSLDTILVVYTPSAKCSITKHKIKVCFLFSFWYWHKFRTHLKKKATKEMCQNSRPKIRSTLLRTTSKLQLGKKQQLRAVTRKKKKEVAIFRRERDAVCVCPVFLLAAAAPAAVEEEYRGRQEPSSALWFPVKGCARPALRAHCVHRKNTHTIIVVEATMCAHIKAKKKPYVCVVLSLYALNAYTHTQREI